MKYSLCGTMNMNWEEVSTLARGAEALGFDQTYTSDHIATVASFDGDKGLLDAVGLLPALAVVTKKIRIGPLSSPFTFRDPAVLMRQLHTVDVLSGGRAMMGVG